MTEVRSITLPQGGTLDVSMEPEFLERVRAQFGLPEGAPVADDHLRMFIWGAVRSGLDRALEHKE